MEDYNFVYSYIFKKSNAVYVGRTNDISRRNCSHHSKADTNKKYVYDSVVNAYSDETGEEIPKMTVLEKNLDIIDSLELEEVWIEYYKNKGYKILNSHQAGLFSGAAPFIENKYSDENIKRFAKKFKSLLEFKVKFPNTYKRFKQMNLLDKLSLPEHPDISKFKTEKSDSDGRNFSAIAKMGYELLNLKTNLSEDEINKKSK